jgi:hypothetical protein
LDKSKQERKLIIQDEFNFLSKERTKRFLFSIKPKDVLRIEHIKIYEGFQFKQRCYVVCLINDANLVLNIYLRWRYHFCNITVKIYLSGVLFNAF